MQTQIPIRHPLHREARGDCGAAGGAVDLVDAGDRIDRRVEAVDQESGHAVDDQLAHRSAVAGDDRRAAGQHLHHREAERLVEIDEVDTLLPGEWYGGQLHLAPPTDQGGAQKTYTVVIIVGTDRHVIDVAQGVPGA